MSEQLVNVTIDGRTVQVPKGMLLVEAAKKAGVEIPVFCYHPKLDPAGVCRMCLVQIEKIPKPQTACTTPVADGMVVHTNTEVVQNLRKGALEFLLINHPLDCPVCDKGGECDLQDLTFEHGASTSRLQDAKIRKEKAVDLGNFIVLDNERCILCRRCVRFDNEVATEGNLIIEERAHFNTVTTMLEQPYDSYFSGNTIELCPVGALTSDLYRFKARPWDLAKVESVCTMCSVGCDTTQDYRHGKLLRIGARDIDNMDNGWLCDRGRFNYQFVQDDDRLTQPLVRKDGQLVQSTWSEAIAAVAEVVGKNKTKPGATSPFGVIGGGRLTNEEAYLLQKFARNVLGTPNVDHRVGGQIISSMISYPGKQEDLSDASAIVIIDTNPAEAAPVMDLRIRRMVDRKKARLAVIGSVMPTYRGRHARVQVKPGQTAAVVEALANVVAGKAATPSAADADSLTKLNELITAGKKVVIVWGGNDAATGKAVLNLAGALKNKANVHVLIPGEQSNSRGAEAMGMLPGYLPGFKVADKVGLSTGEMLKAAADGQIKVLFLFGANLLNTYPDRKLVEAALAKAMIVTSDLFLNETAAKSCVVLPAASTIGEKSGTVTALDGEVGVIKLAKRPEGNAQADGDILVALAQALGTKLAANPAEVAREIAQTVAKLEKGAVLPGAPAGLIPAVQPEAAPTTPNGLVLVPITRLYAGGSTSRFDHGFNYVQPKQEARFNPADAKALGLTAGEKVELTANGASIQGIVNIDKSVVAGTVQAICGLVDAPVNTLTAGTTPVAVTVAKLAVEVAD
ncbi:MAG TPA: NADH-quinone oxidoreductase subunit NuoG [Symbiobacteriaceae bacterium]|nr:NADH-quinone oxidoreductase subunit NuoG [Symbiobacteriaceae bacterium]